jgi:hypothetical protein
VPVQALSLPSIIYSVTYTRKSLTAHSVLSIFVHGVTGTYTVNEELTKTHAFLD